MNSYPAHVYPSLVLSVGLTDLPSPLCPNPPISMVKSLQDVCVLKPYCCLKERPWRREGWEQSGCVCSCWGEGAEWGIQLLAALRHGVGALGWVIFHGKPVEEGCKCWGQWQCWNTALWLRSLCLQSHTAGLQVQLGIGFPGLGGKSCTLGPLNPTTHGTVELMWYPCDSQQHKLTRKWIFWTY